MADVTITVPVPPWWAFVAYIAVGLAVDVWACVLVKRRLRVSWRTVTWRAVVWWAATNPGDAAKAAIGLGSDVASCRPMFIVWPWYLIVGPMLDRIDRRG